MIENYAKIAFRNFRKRIGYTFINVAGLAIGVACCLLISIYVLNELSYDRFIDDSDRIYRITQIPTSSSDQLPAASSPFRTGPFLKAEYPHLVQQQVRLFDTQDAAHTFLSRADDISFRTPDFFFTDSTFFDVFSIDLIRGNPENVLDAPLSLVISEALATTLYPDSDPIGKTLRYKGISSMEMMITGVMKNWPEESHISPNMLASFTSLDILYSQNPDYEDNWWWNPIWTYIKLNEDVTASELEDQLPAFADKYYYPNRPEGETVRLELQPITEIHLYSNLDNEIDANGSVFSIYLFSAVAVLILIIACVNFMNLATARSSERAREVGMRKALGADRGQLFLQFMGESILVSFLAVLIAVFLVYLTLPFFNNFIGKDLALHLFDNLFFFSLLSVIVVGVGFFAGIYPSMFLSGLKPTRVLKGDASLDSKGAFFRKSLVTFQFCLSIILIIGSIVVYLQLQHMQTRDLGFEKERIIILPMSQNLIAWEYDQFKERALQNPNILAVTGISHVLGERDGESWKIYPANISQGEEKSTLTLHVNHDFVETFGIDVIAGRDFSEEFTTDNEQAVLINRQMVEVLGVETPEDALGELFYYDDSNDERHTLSVVGVVENFNFTTIKQEVKPLVIRLSSGTMPILRTLDHAAVKVAPGGMAHAIDYLETVWYEINWVDPFEFSFQDEELAKVYASEMTLGKVTGAFTLLCILVACLGLFGLASFTASKRTKEIGIRKTLGATLGGILILLSKEYIKLILLANIIAWPFVYLLINRWLQDFPYRIEMGWNLIMVFAATGILSVIICLVTVSYQSFKAGRMNPVDSLRSE
ncbi:FtsX-like permease family protein [Rhodohalobacter sp. 614A]|uniref:FtsX-like permease family protein n=1 Tax=Rhodohalobacter sp. 614A TaxID=2908649 RepID=UPI001F3CF397|nr:FtsX-like permease family protein [Rhodohalobacter sp. 614A]